MLTLQDKASLMIKMFLYNRTDKVMSIDYLKKWKLRNFLVSHFTAELEKRNLYFSREFLENKCSNLQSNIESSSRSKSFVEILQTYDFDIPVFSNRELNLSLMDENNYSVEFFGIKMNCLFDNPFLASMTSNEREIGTRNNNFLNFLNNFSTIRYTSNSTVYNGDSFSKFSELAVRNFGEIEFKKLIKPLVLDDYTYALDSNGLSFRYDKEIILNILKADKRGKTENFVLLLFIATPLIAYTYLQALEAERQFLLDSSASKKMFMDSEIMNLFNSLNKRFFYNYIYDENGGNFPTKSLLYFNLETLEVKINSGKFSISKSILDPDYEFLSGN